MLKAFQLFVLRKHTDEAFFVYGEAIPVNGTHIYVNTSKELKEYDPRLYERLSKWLPETYDDFSCHVHED